jgi:precorrin-3B C17-methyltransferase
VSGKLTVVGLGPGNAAQLTAEAITAIEAADALFGYGPYLDRIAQRAGQLRVASDNRCELQRAARALESAVAGANVAVVSGGDPGVFAMAAAVCEAIETGPATWRDLEVNVLPGISAMLAVSARVGAPLGHDFCAISLSDNLKPWSVIEQRLEATASVGLVIALYNPVSRARPWQLDRAFDTLRRQLPGSTPVVFGRAVGRVDERVATVTLQEARAVQADMATCIIVGSAQTRVITRPGQRSIIYTPRSMPG